MNHETVWLMHLMHCNASEKVYKIVHTRDYILEDSGFSIKLPVATLRICLTFMQR